MWRFWTVRDYGDGEWELIISEHDPVKVIEHGEGRLRSYTEPPLRRVIGDRATVLAALADALDGVVQDPDAAVGRGVG